MIVIQTIFLLMRIHVRRRNTSNLKRGSGVQRAGTIARNRETICLSRAPLQYMLESMLKSWPRFLSWVSCVFPCTPPLQSASAVDAGISVKKPAALFFVRVSSVFPYILLLQSASAVDVGIYVEKPAVRLFFRISCVFPCILPLQNASAIDFGI